jgi:hypothetical protein
MQRPPPSFCVCILDHERRRKTFGAWTLRSVLWIETRRFGSKEVVYRAINFWGMWLEFETDEAIDEKTGMSMGNEGESSQVVDMIIYRKAKKLEQMRY